MRGLPESGPGAPGPLAESAARAVAAAALCWLATVDANGSPRLRPMGRLPAEPGDDVWTLRFITDGRSGKAANIRRAGRASLAFQRENEEGFVTVQGPALLEEDRAEVRRRWKRAYDPYFPGEADKASAVFLTVQVDRIDLWIRGVTPEPFGLKTTTIERDGEGRWRLREDNSR